MGCNSSKATAGENDAKTTDPVVKKVTEKTPKKIRKSSEVKKEQTIAENPKKKESDDSPIEETGNNKQLTGVPSSSNSIAETDPAASGDNSQANAHGNGNGMADQRRSIKVPSTLGHQAEPTSPINSGEYPAAHPSNSGEFIRIPPTAQSSFASWDLPRSSSLTNILSVFKPANMHILLVDDDVHCQDTIAEWLSQSKYQVTLCNDGEESVEVLSEAAKEAKGKNVEDIHLILCDYLMQTPSGLPLLDFVLSRSVFSHIPVVLMSGDPSVQVADRTIRRGAEDFLRKPIAKNVLLKTVRTILEKVVEKRNADKMKEWGDKYKKLLMEELPASHQLAKTLSLSSGEQKERDNKGERNSTPRTANNKQDKDSDGSAPASARSDLDAKDNAPNGSNELSGNSLSVTGTGTGHRSKPSHSLLSPGSNERSLTVLKTPDFIKQSLASVENESANPVVALILQEEEAGERERIKGWMEGMNYIVRSLDRISQLQDLLKRIAEQRSKEDAEPLPSIGEEIVDHNHHSQSDAGDASGGGRRESEPRIAAANKRSSIRMMRRAKNAANVAAGFVDETRLDLLIIDAELAEFCSASPASSSSSSSADNANEGGSLLESVIESCSDLSLPLILFHSRVSKAMSESLRKGVENVITKPISRDTLIKKCAIILETLSQKRKAEAFAVRAAHYHTMLAQFRRQREDEIKSGKRSPKYQSPMLKASRELMNAAVSAKMIAAANVQVERKRNYSQSGQSTDSSLVRNHDNEDTDDAQHNGAVQITGVKINVTAT